MPLTLQSRRVGDITVVKCSGRIVAGQEVDALQQHVGTLLPQDRDFILDLAEVPFIDSSGIGALVRLLTRTQSAHGDLKLCSLQPQIAHVLRLTNLHTLLEAHASEADAISAFYGRGRATTARQAGPSVLCVDKSPDLLAYLREVLRRAGYNVLTAGNLPDAVVLLTATQPEAIVISTELREFTGTRAAETFKNAVSGLPVIELAGDFCSSDAGDAAHALLDQLRAAAGDKTRGAAQ